MLTDPNRASKERFNRFTERDAALVRWRFDSGYVAELTVRRYRKMFGNAKRILDIGCGIGEAAKWADEADYFGVDLSEILVRRGRKHRKTLLVAGNVCALPFESGSFEHVTCMGVLHHLGRSEITMAFKEMARVLKSGGLIAVMEPNPWNLYQRLFAYLRPAERGILNTSPQNLHRTIDSIPGLKIEKFEYDHTMFWPSCITFVMRRWSWPTGPVMTGCLMVLHKLVVGLTPRLVQSHTFWHLRKEEP